MTNNTTKDQVLTLFPDNNNNEINAADMRTYVEAVFDDKEVYVTKLRRITDLAGSNANIYEGSLVVVFNDPDPQKIGIYISKLNQPTVEHDLQQISIISNEDVIDLSDHNHAWISTTSANGGSIVSNTDTTVTIAEGYGDIVDNYTDPELPTIYHTAWEEQTITIPMPYDVGYATVYIDIDSQIQVTSSGPLTPSEKRDNIRITKIYYASGVIKEVIPIPFVRNQNYATLCDFITFLPSNLKIQGMNIDKVDDALSIFRHNGNMFTPGINWWEDNKNPNIKAVTAEGDNLTPLTFTIIDRNLSIISTGNTVIPLQWDNDGVITDLGGSTATIHYVLGSIGADMYVLLGQKNYSSYDSALAAHSTDPLYMVYPDIVKSGTLFAQLIVSNGATDFESPETDASIINTSGGAGGISGSQDSDFQAIYNNSVNPEILTDDTRGPLSLKRGTALDTDAVIESINGAGVSTFSVSGDGVVTASSANINLNGNNSIIIDGETNERTITIGAYRQLHKAGVINTRAINLEVDANGYTDTSGIVINYVPTSFIDGYTGRALSLNVNTNNASGGDVDGMTVLKHGTGVLDVHALHVGSGVLPIHQISGSATDVEVALIYDNSSTSYTDVTTEFNSDGSNVTIFEEVDDYVYIGHSSKFTELSFNLLTNSSKTIDPTFEYSTGAGGWDNASPVDGTNGMTSSGIVTANETNILGWNTDTVNGIIDKYWIRVRRNRTTITTPPVESREMVTEGTTYEWDEGGNLSINNVSTSGTIRGKIIVDNDGNFNLNNSNDFTFTPTIDFEINFTNFSNIQKGSIILNNAGGHTITKNTVVKASSTFLSTISVAGTYWIEYISDGTNVYVNVGSSLS